MLPDGVAAERVAQDRVDASERELAGAPHIILLKTELHDYSWSG
jgi:hypothetical protein